MLTLLLLGVGIALLSRLLAHMPPGRGPAPKLPQIRTRPIANGDRPGCHCPTCGIDK